MLPRVLYLDDDVALELDWLGLGKLRVRHRLGGKRVAHRIQKQCFLAVIAAFEQSGQPVSPANPRCSAMLKDFADLLLTQSPVSIAWRLLYDDPEGAGRRYAAD